MNPSSQWTRLELSLDLSSPIRDKKKGLDSVRPDNVLFLKLRMQISVLNVSNAMLSQLPENASRDHRVMIRHQCNGVDEAPGQKAVSGMNGK